MLDEKALDMTTQQPFVELFDADGAVCIRKAFNDDWVDVARQGIARNIANPSPFFRNLAEQGGGFLCDMWSRRTIPEFERFCMESPAAGLAAQALRSDRLRLAQDLWFVKQPGSSDRTPWHHDTVVTGPFCSIWVALDPTPRSATLEFVRGSHAWGKVMMPRSFFDAPTASADGESRRDAVDQFYVDFHGDAQHRADAQVFGEIPDIEADRDAYDIIGWDMQPGDCVLFDTRTIHGAPGNSLDRPIRRFVTRWITDDSVISPHGQGVIDALAMAGLEIDLKVDQPIRGALFPEVHISRG